MRTYTIELRIDFDDDVENKKDVMNKAVRMAAKHLLGSAIIISDKRKPEISAQYDDFWVGTSEIELEDDFDAPSKADPAEDPFSI
jgi:hypothetical protein